MAILHFCVNSILTRMPTPQEMAKTMNKMHSFLRRMEAARDLLTPLSKNPTSRVPHSVLVGFGFDVRFPSHRQVVGPSNPNDSSIRTAQHHTNEIETQRTREKVQGRKEQMSGGK